MGKPDHEVCTEWLLTDKHVSSVSDEEAESGSEKDGEEEEEEENEREDDAEEPSFVMGKRWLQKNLIRKAARSWKHSRLRDQTPVKAQTGHVDVEK